MTEYVYRDGNGNTLNSDREVADLLLEMLDMCHEIAMSSFSEFLAREYDLYGALMADPREVREEWAAYVRDRAPDELEDMTGYALCEVSYVRVGRDPGKGLDTATIAERCRNLAYVLSGRCVTDADGSACLDLLDAARYLVDTVLSSEWYKGDAPDGERMMMHKAATTLKRVGDRIHDGITDTDTNMWLYREEESE